MPSPSPADLLASLAVHLGVGWDGPGEPSVPADRLPPLDAATPGWELLDSTRERALATSERRRLGAHHTPPALARRLVAIALEGTDHLGAAGVLDPACGGGAFLVAAAEELVARGMAPLAALGALRGLDVDPLAAATTRAALACWAAARGVAPASASAATAAQVRTGDFLDPGEAWGQAGLVVGNPPFLSPLASDTGGGPHAEELRRALGAPYADVASLFALRALDLVVPAGRVVLLQPESLLASRDARPLRDRATPSLVGLWIAGEAVFGAAVRVCAPVLAGEAVPGRTVRRWQGAAVRPLRAAARPAASSWSPLRPTTAPAVRLARHAGTVGDRATATAGFRDEYYAVVAALAEGGPGVPVVTSGLVDPGHVAWGERPARIGGARRLRPTVEPGDLAGRAGAWARARLRPKVLVATQTRVLEAAPDPEGRFLPLTPVLSVEPADPDDSDEVWRLAAALTSPALSAWAVRRHGGSALSGDAVKLSARELLDAPLPTDAGAWAAATELLRAGDVVGCGRALAGDDRVLAWWLARLPKGFDIPPSGSVH